MPRSSPTVTVVGAGFGGIGMAVRPWPSRPGAHVTASAFTPLTADLSGLLPMVVQVGSEEILLPDAVGTLGTALAERLTAPVDSATG